MPEISVIVPVYNAEGFLRKCTDSILGQSFSDVELLLIEDGSPDGSGALCDKISTEDTRVRVIHKENGGVSSARNLGMREALGRFIAFVDADDWLAPDALEALHAIAIQAGADTAGCAHYKAELSGALTAEAGAMQPGVYGPQELREGIVNRLLGDRLGSPEELLNGFIWRFLFSREIITAHQLRFAGAYLEDELFLMEYFCYAKKLAMTDRPLYYYLQNPQSVTRTYLPDYMETFSHFMAAKEELAQRFGLDEAQPQWRENSNWSGLLIAVGNEYAPSNPAPLSEKRRRVKAITRLPQMERAIHAIRPQGLGRNKQVVADRICRRQHLLLSLLYTIKNRNR